MPFYHFYHIEHFQLLGADTFHAADDADAIRDAGLLNGTSVWELWEGGRKIAMLPPDGEAAGQATIASR